MPLQSLSNKTNNTLSGDNSLIYLFIFVLSSNLMLETKNLFLVYIYI